MAHNSSPFFAPPHPNSAKPRLLAGLQHLESTFALAAALKIAHESEAEPLAAALIHHLEGWPQDRPVPAPTPFLFLANLHRRHTAKRAAGVHRQGASSLLFAWRLLSAPTRRRARVFFQVESPVVSTLPNAPSARESLARFIGDSGDPSLLHLLLPMILDADTRIASAAEESLIRAALWLSPCPPPSALEFTPPPRFEYLDLPQQPISVDSLAATRAHLAHLCREYSDHRRKGVLAAAIALLDPAAIAFSGDPLGQWFLDDAAGSHPTLRSMLRRGTGPLSRARAWEWLTRPAFAASVEDRLSRADSPEEFNVVLERRHLLENPRRAARLAGLRQRRRLPLIPPLDAIASLSPAARRGMCRMPGIDEPELLSLLTDPDDTARLTAAAALPHNAVLDYCFDPHESIAHLAAVRWWWGGVSPGQTAKRVAEDHADPPATKALAPSLAERSRVATNLARSQHPSVRSLARGFLGESRSHAAAQLDLLRIAIRTGEGENRLQAIQHARRLGLQRSIELELLSIISAGADSEPVLASAVSALGEAGSNSSAEAVELCLTHAIPRIRANAAEGLVKRSLGRGDLAAQSPRLYDSLIEMKSDPSHRVRATAIRAMLRAACPQWGGTGFEPAAADELLKMLDDDRSMHRLAGLWAAEHAGDGDSIRRRWDQLASRVAHLAADDPDDAVQRRAVWCARRLLSREPSLPELEPSR